MLSTVTSAAPAPVAVSASPSRAMNATTPTPSLNRLSPAIVACSSGDSPTRRSTSSTATGSVGATIAPSTRHHTIGTARPSPASTSQIPPANSAIASATPTVDSSSTVPRRRHSMSRSTCSAPANSRNDRAPDRKVRGRSVCATTCSAILRSPSPGQTAWSATSSSDASIASSSSPIVVGRRSVTWFTVPNSAASPNSRETSWKLVIVAPSRCGSVGRAAQGRRQAARSCKQELAGLPNPGSAADAPCA